MAKMALPPGLEPQAPDHDKIRAQISEAVGQFAGAMLAKMTTPKNLAKSDRDLWNILPMEALREKLEIEYREYQVAQKYEGHRAAQGELVDLANFAMMLWVRHKLMQERTDNGDA